MLRITAYCSLLTAYCNPTLDLRAKHTERNGPILEDAIVECLDVELVAQLGTSFFAQPHDLGAADHVGRRLARPGDIPVDFALGDVLRQHCVAEQVIERLLAGPSP